MLACAATFFSQHGEIQRLQSQLASLTAATTERDAGSPGLGGVVAISESSPTAEDKRAEIERLRAELAELNAVAAQGAQLLAERRQLEAQLAARSGLAPDELSALDQARDRAKSIKCVNNLKNIGLALRIWATDREGSFPMDFLSLTNELATPKLLICPADTAHSEAPDWSSFNTSHVSYEFLAPGGGDDEPHRVAARCTFHRHICLTDGSVQMSQGDGSNLTQRLVTRNGKVYYEEPR